MGIRINPPEKNEGRCGGCFGVYWKRFRFPHPEKAFFGACHAAVSGVEKAVFGLFYFSVSRSRKNSKGWKIKFQGLEI